MAVPILPDGLSRGTLVQVTAPSFTGALIIYRANVITCAPILRQLIHQKSASEALDMFWKKGYGITFLHATE